MLKRAIIALFGALILLDTRRHRRSRGGDLAGCWDPDAGLGTGSVQHGHVCWNNINRNGEWPKVNIEVQSNQLPSDKCVEIGFDWQPDTEGEPQRGHFDLRIVRVCADGAIRRNYIPPPPSQSDYIETCSGDTICRNAGSTERVQGGDLDTTGERWAA